MDAAQVRIISRMERAVGKLEGMGRWRDARIMENAVVQAVERGNFDYVKSLELSRHVPVTINEFVESPEFLGRMLSVWPALREDLRHLHPDHMTGAGPVKTEAILGGATGWGKSVLLQISIMYVAYFLSCFRTPQRLFKNLSSYTPIVLMLQSVREDVTKRVLYNPIREMFTSMPFAQRHIRWDKYKEAALILEGGIEIVPALANIQSMLGAAVIAGALDEVNFMTVVESSKRVAGPRGEGGKYDQAEQVYKALARRRVSRFLTDGPNPGGIYLSSSAHYVGDFLDRRIREVRERGWDNEHVYVVERAQYETRPEGTYSGVTFRFLVGTDEYPPRVLEDDEQVERGRVVRVPVEYLEFFLTDPYGAQRDILGIASSAISRFIPNVQVIMDAVLAFKEAGGRSYIAKPNVHLATDGMPRIAEDSLPADRDAKRFVHVDLALTGDRCGIAIAKVVDYVDVLSDAGAVERLPVIEVEAAVSLEPSATREIDIAEVRRWIIALKEIHGLNIYQVTYDGFQSRESIQSLVRRGMRSGQVSMDKTTEPYDVLKRALQEHRVRMVDNDLARHELATLEKHVKGARVIIDHPPNGSKDIADAIAGAVFSATRSRMVRSALLRGDKAGSGRPTVRKRPQARRRTSRR